MLGYSSEEMIGRGLGEFLDDNNKKILIENVEKRTKGIASQYELEWTKKTGELLPTIVSGAPLIDEDGNHRGSFAVITDITELRNFEKAIAESEEKYRSLVDAAPFSITLTDLEGKILMVNKRTLEMYGCQRDEDMVGMSSLDLIVPEQRERAIKNLQMTLENGTNQGLEYELLRVDGSTYPAEVSASVIYDSDGKPFAFSGIIRDITYRKLHQEELRISEERYRVLFENLSDGLFQTDMTGTIIMSSPTAARLFGMTENEVVGLKFYELVHPEDKDELIHAFKNGLDTQKTLRAGIEARGMRKDGSIFYYHITNTILTEDEKPVGYQSLIRDITPMKEAEKARRESEEKYRTLAENSLQGVTVIQDDKYVYVNNAFASMVGCQVHEIMEMAPRDQWDLIHPEDKSYLLQLADDRKSGKPIPMPYEYRLLTKDDKTRWVAAFSNVIEYGGKNALQVMLVDITDRKTAENALREEESKYRALAEQSLQGISIMQDEAVVYANQAYSDIVGFSVDEILDFTSTQVWGMIHEDDRERLRERFREYMATKEVQDRTEYRIVRKDGHVRWVESYVSIIEYSGQPAMQTVLVDITDRRGAQEAILNSEIKYRTLAEQSLQGLTILQDDGLVYTNRAFARIVGKRPDELMEMSLTDIYNMFHPDDRKDFRQRILDRLAGRESPARSEYRIIRSNGETRWVETFASTIEYAGHPAIQTVLVDVTDRKVAERELRSAKDRALLYMDLMGHDIRNQLQVIMGSAALLRNATEEAVKESFLEVIKKSVQRCSRMIEEVKETEHLMAVPLIDRPLVKSVESCIEAIAARVEGVEFHRNYRIPEAIIEADNYLELLLSNILMNAIEHNKSESKQIWVTISEEPDGYLVSIADNGPGITDSLKADLFEMSRRFGGLGLHQSKQIVDKYLGRIDVVDRVPGKPEDGAEFRIVFQKFE